MIRLAYLSPDVLKQFVLRRRPPMLSLIGLSEVAALPWVEQRAVVLE